MASETWGFNTSKTQNVVIVPKHNNSPVELAQQTPTDVHSTFGRIKSRPLVSWIPKQIVELQRLLKPPFRKIHCKLKIESWKRNKGKCATNLIPIVLKGEVIAHAWFDNKTDWNDTTNLSQWWKTRTHYDLTHDFDDTLTLDSLNVIFYGIDGFLYIIPHTILT